LITHQWSSEVVADLCLSNRCCHLNCSSCYMVGMGSSGMHRDLLHRNRGHTWASSDYISKKELQQHVGCCYNSACRISCRSWNVETHCEEFVARSCCGGGAQGNGFWRASQLEAPLQDSHCRRLSAFRDIGRTSHCPHLQNAAKKMIRNSYNS